MVRRTICLAQLTWLDLYNPPIAEMTALARLAWLTWLNLRGTEIRDRTCPVQPERVCLFSPTDSIDPSETRADVALANPPL